MLNGKSIVITGGTGSFGQHFTATVLRRYPEIREIVIFSRDSAKQEAMSRKLNDPRLRFVAGDMADREALRQACERTELIVHTAAMRIVPEAEAHPAECIRTNILGAQNLIETALEKGIPRILALSTDMASHANNVYGATKLLSDRLFTAIHGDFPELKTTVIRYGNMLGSTGTVIPFFLRKAREGGALPITDPRMSRFMATLDECVEIALRAVSESLGGEIIVPKLKAYDIMTVAHAIAPHLPTTVVGLRPGEKLYEEMVTRYEAHRTIETGHCYIIVPSYGDMETYCHHHKAVAVGADFEFNSANTASRFTEEEIRQLASTLE